MSRSLNRCHTLKLQKRQPLPFNTRWNNLPIFNRHLSKKKKKSDCFRKKFLNQILSVWILIFDGSRSGRWRQSLIFQADYKLCNKFQNCKEFLSNKKPSMLNWFEPKMSCSLKSKNTGKSGKHDSPLNSQHEIPNLGLLVK